MQNFGGNFEDCVELVVSLLTRLGVYGRVAENQKITVWRKHGKPQGNKCEKLHFRLYYIFNTKK